MPMGPCSGALSDHILSNCIHLRLSSDLLGECIAGVQWSRTIRAAQRGPIH